MISNETTLPSGRRFHRQFTLFMASVGIAAALMIVLYLLALLRLPPHHLTGLWWSVLAVTLVGSPGLNYLQYRTTRPLVMCLDELAAGGPAPSVPQGFACAVDLPRRIFLLQFTHLQGAAILVVACMALWFDDFTLRSAALMMAAVLSGGLLSTIVQCFILKRWLEPLRNELAKQIEDPEERAALTRPFPIVWKLSVVMVTLALVPVVFSVLLANARMGTSAEQLASDIHAGLLELGVERYALGALAGVEGARIEARRWNLPSQLIVLSRTAGQVVAGPTDLLSTREMEWLSATETEMGDAEALRSANLVHFIRLPGTDHVLAAVTPRLALARNDGLSFLFALLVAGSGLVALGVAWMVSRDVGRAAERLRADAERVAAGDLRTFELFESEDELGAVGRTFATMADSLRRTVGSVARAAGRVDQSVDEISSISQLVAGVTADQVRGIQNAVAAIESVQERATGIAASADELSELAEQSSSSTLEVGAANEQVRDTAGIVASRVEDVTSSIEQLVHSVKTVRASTESLTDAASETSSSMEEMASAMRQVDSTAQQSSELSNQMISAAESGRAMVDKTVEGMISIRSATEAAEHVVRGLDQRTGKMAAILDVIDDVAEETNLLALNAAIISAQAGEHGRAFAVVAGEIKALANRVLSSTKEIGGLIEGVQTESRNAIGAIEAGTQSVSEGVQLSAQAGESLAEIDHAAKENAERLTQIVTAVREQTKAAAHVAGLMERVLSGVEEIRHATSEQDRGNEVISRSTLEMREVTQQLSRTTDEQARGSQRIRESVEGVRGAIESISQLLQRQTASIREAADLMQSVSGRTASNEEAGGRLSETTRELLAQAEALHQDVDRFTIE